VCSSDLSATQNSDGDISSNLLGELVRQSPLVRNLLLEAGVTQDQLMEMRVESEHAQ